MSIVICKVIENGLWIHSDTRGWNPLAQKSEVFTGFLKSVIMSPQICICWAGNAETAKDAFEGIDKKWIDDQNLERLRAYLEDQSRSIHADHSVDFILAHHSGKPSVWKISEGKTDDSHNGFVWIGDYDAYRYFIGTWRESRGKESIEEYRLIEESFSHMIENVPCKTVGDFRISVASGGNGFNYRMYGQSRSPLLRVPPGESILELKSNAEGGFNISCLTACPNAKPGCALYFMPAAFGVVLDPSNPFDFSAIIRLPIEDFLYEVNSKYGLELSGAVQHEDGRITTFGKRAPIMRASISGDNLKGRLRILKDEGGDLIEV